VSKNIRIFDQFVKSDKKDDSLILKLGNILTLNSDPREFGNSYTSFMNSGDIDLIADKALLDRVEIYYRIFCEGYNNSSEYPKTFNIHNI
tara:strand:+ start:643 stop:912 length:270 start_codon:yes stop_codon:yes gene_type:complete